MPELERWGAAPRVGLDKVMRAACSRYDFHGLFNELHNFCAVDLSAFYFDIRKDAVYCDAPTDARRRAAARCWIRSITAWSRGSRRSSASRRRERGSRVIPARTARFTCSRSPTFPTPGAMKRWRKSGRRFSALRRAWSRVLWKSRAPIKIGASLQTSPKVWAPAELVGGHTRSLRLRKTSASPRISPSPKARRRRTLTFCRMFRARAWWWNWRKATSARVAGKCCPTSASKNTPWRMQTLRETRSTSSAADGVSRDPWRKLLFRSSQARRWPVLGFAVAVTAAAPRSII